MGDGHLEIRVLNHFEKPHLRGGIPGDSGSGAFPSTSIYLLICLTAISSVVVFPLPVHHSDPRG